MDPTLFSYIWRHSARQQLMLLAITIASFPVLYMTLEIPKVIVNDAIGGDGSPVEAFGFTFTQIEFLAALCAAFIGFVLMSGVIKMKLNTFKGVVAERLLRRFRYQLINRILRFPLPHFRRTSQGELISMVTSEAEPLGGLMGDAVAQPVFQAGQMLTILAFLFMQNVWFGLAAIALIPVQAYVIPMLQRRINLLNKERVQHVRKLAERIGEGVAGVEDLRSNYGAPYALADFSKRLGDLFHIRYKIYRQKFFMKFLNNFINQLTPFFFFAIGGYLVIQGELTVGALVAALAAYKDLSAPWKELLTYYNQVQDMGLRYQTIVEQFAPRGMIDSALFNGRPEDTPSLKGPISLKNVTVSTPGGDPVLANLDAEIPAGSMVAIKSESAVERKAMAQLLSRATLPSAGRVEVAGQNLSELHQGVIAARIGVASGQPYLFNAPIEENVKMSLRRAPRLSAAEHAALEADIEEAVAAGATPDPRDADWLDPSLIGFESQEALDAWWLKILHAIGTEDYLFDRCVHLTIDPEKRHELAQKVVALRPKLWARIEAAGLAKAVHRFDPDVFNPGLDLASNLLFATPRVKISPEEMSRDPRFQQALKDFEIEDELLDLAEDLLTTLVRTFGEVGTDHPLFQRLSGVDPELFQRLAALPDIGRGGERNVEQRALLLALPFMVAAEQLGDVFPAKLAPRMRNMCRVARGELRAQAGDVFAPLSADAYAPGLCLYENALFGKVSQQAGAKAEKLKALVAEVFAEEGLKGPVALLIGDVEAGIGGANLPPFAHERIAFVRAAIKKPDILVLDRALATHSADSRAAMRKNLRDLLPETTILFLEPSFANQSQYDMFLEISDGRLVKAGGVGKTVDEMLTEVKSTSADLKTKLRVLENVSLFEGLDRQDLRLLAYASRWIKAEPGEALFRAGDPTDGAYVLTEGQAQLLWPRANVAGERRVISEVEPGRVVGDMSVIRGTPRNIDLVATTEVVGLRIGNDELLDVVNHDPKVAMSLLRTVAGYLVDIVSELDKAIGQEPERTK
ncbi:MAG: cyclic nucleotide-binding domain-containing protein [Rhodobacteraceae bacterium]|nr:cyclic nucleotide-binding domain-containing protein [Paracoccaceae bacterium]